MSLGFCLVKIHGDTSPKPTFNYKCYNPRPPPEDSVAAMAAKMTKKCLSDERYLSAAVSKKFITNIPQLLPNYSPEDYEKIPYAEFEQSGTVFFLTGWTRTAASKIYFEDLVKKGKSKPKNGARKRFNGDVTGRCTPLFKAANWVV